MEENHSPLLSSLSKLLNRPLLLHEWKDTLELNLLHRTSILNEFENQASSRCKEWSKHQGHNRHELDENIEWRTKVSSIGFPICVTYESQLLILTTSFNFLFYRIWIWKNPPLYYVLFLYHPLLQNFHKINSMTSIKYLYSIKLIHKKISLWIE